MKKTLCLLLSAIMLLGALPFAASGASIINLVDLDGIVPPSVDAYPEWNIGTNDSKYEVVNVEWFDQERGVDMTPGEEFLAGHSYRLKIYVVTADGWEFRTDGVSGDPFVAILHNGYQIDDFYCIYGNESQLLVQIDYEALPGVISSTVNEVNITIDNPVTGVAPSFTKIDTDRYYSDGNISPESKGIKWYDVTDGKYLISGTGAKFTCGHTYRVSVSLTTKGEYEFGNATATVNGKAALLDWYNPYMVTVTYTFDELVCVPEFVQGEFPSCDGTGHVGYFACPCGKWYWDAEGTNPIENEEDILIPPTGAHNEEQVVTKATTSKNGKIVTKCSECGETLSTQTIAKVTSFTLSTTDYVYDGKNKTPKVTVKDANGKQLTKNVDYKTSIASSRSNIGKYYVKVTLIGNYEGTKNVYFYIRPGVPTKLTATQSTSYVKLTWDKAPGAAGYSVYRYDKATDSYKKLKATTALTYTDKDVKAGTKYTYKVVPYGRSRLNNVYYSKGNIIIETATKTSTPSITVTSSSKTKALVKWNNVSGESGYQVWYSTSKDGTYKRFGNAKANATSLTVTGLTSGKTYYFKVRTYTKTDSGYVYGSWSNIKSVKVK